MSKPGEPSDTKAIYTLSTLGGIIGGLCCFPPIIMVLLGLASVSAAASFGNVLYGEYRWLFRAIALVFLMGGLVLYFRRRGICTLEDARRERNRVINVAFLVIFTAVGMYVFWTYVVLHYWGIAVGLPWAQYDESWAIPLSAVLLGLAVVAFLVLRRPWVRGQRYEGRQGPA